MPSWITLRDRPVARATALIPPQPIASASDAATARRPRSSNVPATRAYRSVIAVIAASPCLLIPSVYDRRP